MSDDMPQSRPAPREGTERAYYEDFMALAAAPEGDLGVVASPVFEGVAPENERVALLRALWDSEAPAREVWFARALGRSRERSSAMAASPAAVVDHVPVADFAVAFLAARAPRDAVALDMLARFASAPPPDCEPDRVRRAAAVVAAHGSAAQVQRLAASAASSGDPALLPTVQAAAAGNENAAGLTGPPPRDSQPDPSEAVAGE